MAGICTCFEKCDIYLKKQRTHLFEEAEDMAVVHWMLKSETALTEVTPGSCLSRGAQTSAAPGVARGVGLTVTGLRTVLPEPPLCTHCQRNTHTHRGERGVQSDYVIYIFSTRETSSHDLPPLIFLSPPLPLSFSLSLSLSLPLLSSLFLSLSLCVCVRVNYQMCVCVFVPVCLCFREGNRDSYRNREQLKVLIGGLITSGMNVLGQERKMFCM